MTVSSSGALPARSPMPETVTWATSTPAASAMTVLLTLCPKSLWTWTSSGLPLTRAWADLTISGMAWGEMVPVVSTRASASM